MRTAVLVMGLLAELFIASASIMPPRPAHCTVFTEFATPPELRLVRFVQPKYPPDLVATKQAGRVVVAVVVGTDGSVLEVEIIESAHASFTKAVVTAAKSWRFEGPDFGRGPTCVDQVVEIEFRPDN